MEVEQRSGSPDQRRMTMRNRVVVWARLIVAIGAVAMMLEEPLLFGQSLLGQRSAQTQAQLAGCRSVAQFQMPDVNWNEATVTLTGYDQYGYATFMWNVPSRGLSGTNRLAFVSIGHESPAL